jgi:hypothetical protein
MGKDQLKTWLSKTRKKLSPFGFLYIALSLIFQGHLYWKAYKTPGLNACCHEGPGNERFQVTHLVELRNWAIRK